MILNGEHVEQLQASCADDRSIKWLNYMIKIEIFDKTNIYLPLSQQFYISTPTYLSKREKTMCMCV